MIELKGPGAAEIKNFIKEKNMVEFYLLNDKTLSGQILWHDDSIFHIKAEDGKILSLFKKAVVYYARIK